MRNCLDPQREMTTMAALAHTRITGGRVCYAAVAVPGDTAWDSITWHGKRKPWREKLRRMMRSRLRFLCK